MTIRVTDSYLSSILVGDLNRSLSTLLQQQRMAGSMRRINSFADDPRAVGSIQRYNSLLANNDQYLNNLTRSRIIVDGTDVALQNISDVLADVRVIALRESSAIATSQSNDTSVVEVDNLVHRMLDVLNTTIEGNYIFAGRDTNTPPFVSSNGTVVYQGDSEEIRSRTGPNSTMAVNIPGDVFLGSQSSLLGGGMDLAPEVQGTTLLSDLNTGGGWTPGRIFIEDGLGNNFEVDLSSSLTVADALLAINTATGGTVTATISSDSTGLEFSGTGPLTISEVAGGNTATSLGINATSEGGILIGRDVRPRSEASTNLADIANLNGSLPLGTIEVEWQGSTYTIDFSGATTLGDLQATFDAAVPGMQMQIQDSNIVLVGGSPETFTVVNADATNTASALGISGTGTPVRLFGMLEDLKAALESGDKDAIRNSANELASIENTIYQLMMKNGGRQKDLDWADEILRQRDERLRGNLSLEYDADVAQVASDLSRAEASYQASLLVTSKLYTANLMQYLR